MFEYKKYFILLHILSDDLLSETKQQIELTLLPSGKNMNWPDCPLGKI